MAQSEKEKRPRPEEKHEIVKLNDIEHALHAADFYIGQSVRTISPPVSRFVLNSTTRLMEWREGIQYPHGLLKIFDEALVNAADNRHRGTSVIKVGVSLLHNSVWVYNDGPNFSVTPTEHASRWDPSQKAYQPEVAFFHCKTSSAYTKKQRITGGKFGLGAKLIAIFSHWCSIEMSDGTTSYFQKCTDHMNTVLAPTVKPTKEKPFLAICFSPDLSLFYPPEPKVPQVLPDPVLDLFLTRAYDIAGTVGKDVKVYWSLNRNQFLAPKSGTFERIPVKGFKDYVKLFVPVELKEELEHPDSPGLKIGYHAQDRWEVCVISNPWPSPVNVSFVNCVNTYQGGEHVRYIQSQIYQFCKSKVEGVDARRVHQAVMVFVNATIEDPSFNSQCKEVLQTLPAAFGSVCVLPDKFFGVLSRNGVIEALKVKMESKELAQVRRSIGASKSRPVHDIPNFRDAQYAGTRNAHKCSIYLVEGNSAMNLAEVGIAVLGSEYVGAMAVKGKVINVDTSLKALARNVEFVNLCRAIGLDIEKQVPLSQLRYGRVVVMTDADPDGSHIRGLILHMFAKFWPHLLREEGFISTMITPIVVARKAKQTEYFYTMQSFDAWLHGGPSRKQWTIKYLKGLGSSTSKEGRFYFQNPRDHIRNFVKAEDADFQALKLVFDKKQAEQRKQWLRAYDKSVFIPYDRQRQLSVRQFVHEDMVHFSWLSVCRANPAIEDGLTPAARKCLWTFLRRRIIKDVKVSTLQSYASEDTSYHHGSDSLGKTIIRMAQTFVGSQNVNLFYPSGQFGTRVDGGASPAATRYIFSRLTSIARAIFCEDDDACLTMHRDEDASEIEPVVMAPIIPMLLANGAHGVGTAFSCNVACYRPEDLIAATRRALDGQPWQPLSPWYHKFKGEIQSDARGTFHSSGVAEHVNGKTWRITELPVKVWRDKYKGTLCSMVEDGKIEGFHELHRNENVCFEVTTTRADLPEGVDPKRFFHLNNRFVSQLNLFCDEKLVTFASIQEIFERWFAFRLPL